MQCDTMRPETGSTSRTRTNWPVSLFLPTVSCLSHAVNSIRRPRTGDELTSWPLLQQPPQHLPSIPMPYLPTLTPTNVATPTPRHVSSPGTNLLCLQQPKPLHCLWKQKTTQQPSCNTPQRGDRSPRGAQSPRQARSSRENSSRYRGCCPSQSFSRQSHHCSLSHSQFHSTSHSPFHSASPHWHDRSHCQHTPFWYFQDSNEIIPADSVETSTEPKGSLYTERAWDGQVSFFTRLQLPTKHGIKLMTMKIDPGAQVNTIPLRRYQKLYPHKVCEMRFPKSGTLIPTSHAWISHDSSPKPFLGHFIAEVQHATLPK